MPSEVVASETMEQATVNVSGAGLVVGCSLGALSVLWALLVVSGAAQSLIDLIVRLHVIGQIYVIEDIDPMRVVALFPTAGAIGYALGGTFARLWNNRFRRV